MAAAGTHDCVSLERCGDTSTAARRGHLDCAKYLVDVLGFPWDPETARWAAMRGDGCFLRFARERGCPGCCWEPATASPKPYQTVARGMFEAARDIERAEAQQPISLVVEYPSTAEQMAAADEYNRELEHGQTEPSEERLIEAVQELSKHIREFTDRLKVEGAAMFAPDAAHGGAGSASQ